MKYATIIGSRNITNEEFVLLREIATKLSYRGFVLRSGGADGADSTINHLNNVEIIIPWNGFNSLNHDGKRIFSLDRLPDRDLAEKKAKNIHPMPQLLGQGALSLHTRNIYQIIGPKGARGIKSNIVVYCADDDINGSPQGGTRTAVMFARELGVPTYNIRGDESDVEQILEKILFLLR